MAASMTEIYRSSNGDPCQLVRTIHTSVLDHNVHSASVISGTMRAGAGARPLEVVLHGSCGGHEYAECQCRSGKPSRVIACRP